MMHTSFYRGISRPHIGTVTPNITLANRRLWHLRGRVLNKERSPVTDQYGSFSDSTDDERPTNPASPAIRVLFDESHISNWRPELIAYAPFGIFLAAFRSALWILGISLDQPWFRNQSVVEAYLRLLGVTVVWQHPERIPEGRHILVSNHCSVGDLMVLFSHPSLPRRYVHLITSALPARVTQSKHLPVVLRPASPAVYDELASSSETSSVHLFPEGGMTNGHGMLRFSRGFTRIMQQQQRQQQTAPQQPQLQQQHHQQSSQQQPQRHQPQPHAQHALQLPQKELERDKGATFGQEPSTAAGGGGPVPALGPAPATLPVVPVALRVRSMPGVCNHTLASSFLANLFWFSFSPSTTLEATVLPPLAPQPGESRGAFVNRVQAAIAEELGVEVYDMTIQQKRQLAKLAGTRL